MKILFIVQGEGRGHMTQALALEHVLNTAGHHVSDVIVGTCNHREIPFFFRDKSKAQLHTIESPNFYFDKKNKSIHVFKTLYHNLIKTPRFIRQLFKIHSIYRPAQHDMIINFYDMLGGIYFATFRPQAQTVAIAHQYMALLKNFPFADGYFWQKKAFQWTNTISSANTQKILALSFQPLPSEQDKVQVMPPLLRPEVKQLQPTDQGFILAYVVNKGYGEDIMAWQKQHSNIIIHCFWDNSKEPDGWSPQPNIYFHHINDSHFLEKMAACSGYISTAGFESICEAAFLNKPIMMVPVAGQYEQACNAKDALRAKIGITASGFEVDQLLQHMSSFVTSHSIKQWVLRGEYEFPKVITQKLSQENLQWARNFQ